MPEATTPVTARARHAPRQDCDGARIARITILLGLLALGVTPRVAAAHWGGLDHYGCHTDHKAETYHCHIGRFAGQSFSSKDAMLRQLGASAGSWTSPAGTD